MWTRILFALWFFLPAGLSNTAPVLVAKVPVLKKFTYPADFYKKLNGKRILGDHKTIRGFIAGILTAILITALEKQIYLSSEWVRGIVPLDYGTFDVLLFGFLSGAGALLGDSVKSFFKRQLEIKPGKAWIPFDQIDYIIGGILFTMLYVRLDATEYLILFIIWAVLHPLSTVTGYLLKLKAEPI